MGALQELEEIWAEVQRTGHGAHVRIEGAGARGLASRFVAAHGCLDILGAQQVSGGEPTIAWFDGVGAAVVAADRCAVAVALTRDPWLVLTTIDLPVGLPLFGRTLTIESDVSGTGEPTRAEDRFAMERDIEAAISMALDEGDIAGAYLGATHLDGESARRWAFLRVARLARLYRRDEATALAQVLADGGVDAGEMLAELALLHHVMGEPERAAVLAELSNTPHGTHIRGLVAVNMGRLDWEDLPIDRPCRRVMVDVAEAVMEGDDSLEFLKEHRFLFAQALALEFGVQRAPRSCIDLYCVLGRADDAWRAAMTSTRGAPHLQKLSHRPFTRALTQVERLLPDHPQEALDRLDGIQPRLESLIGLHVQQSVLLRAIATALLGDFRAFHSALSKLHNIRLHSPAVPILERFSMPPWAMARLVDLAPQLSAPLPERPVVMGDFIAIEPIGAGGMGEVWRGEHAALGRAVAIKVMALDEPGAIGIFEAEIEAVSRLDHPAIVQVLDVGKLGPAAERQTRGELTAGTPFLVMELATGTLDEFCGCLGWGEVRDIVLALLDALSYAHARGVVHRDIKPGNILYMDAPSGTTIRLSDFGLVGSGGAGLVATPTYLAPEVWTSGRFSSASDLYAVGCLSVALLTGLPPFIGGTKGLAEAHMSRAPDLDVPEIPVAARGWIGQLLAKPPRDRPTVIEAREELIRIQISDSAPIPGRSGGTTPRRSGTTFVLTTLLGSLAPEPPPVELEMGSGRLPHEWRSSRPMRRRLPTPRLWSRGDPPVIGRGAVQDRLWSLLRTAIDEDRPMLVRLMGLRGSGRRSLVRWLGWRAAELGGRCGLSHQTAPGAGPWVVDAGDLPMEVVEPWLEGPVVVVWTRGGPPEVEAIELPALDAVSVGAVLLDRVPLEISSLVRMADSTQTLGRPGLALAHLEAELPFSMPVPGWPMLRTRAILPREPAGVLEWWRLALELDADAKTRACLEGAAVLGALLPGELEALTGDPLALERLKPWVGWEVPYRLPRAAVEVLREAIGSRWKPLHRRAAEEIDDPVRREVHRAHADPHRADLGLLVAAAEARQWFDGPWSQGICEAAERVFTVGFIGALDPRRAPVELLELELLRLREHSIERHISRLERFVDKWAVVSRPHAAVAMNKLASLSVRRDLPSARGALERADQLSSGLGECEWVAASSWVWFALREGRQQEARRLVEAREYSFKAPLGEGDGWCLWIEAAAEVFPLETCAAHLAHALEGDISRGARVRLHRDLGACLGTMGDIESSVRHSRVALELSFGFVQVGILANLTEGLVMLGDRQGAARTAAWGLRSAVVSVSPLLGFFHRAVYATRTDFRGRGWENGWAMMPPCENDPDIVEVLERGIRWAREDGQPGRASLMEAEANRIREALGLPVQHRGMNSPNAFTARWRSVVRERTEPPNTSREVKVVMETTDTTQATATTGPNRAAMGTKNPAPMPPPTPPTNEP